MLKTIVIAHNSLDQSTWETVEAEDLATVLMERFTRLPDNARIYQGSVSVENDITPNTEAECFELFNKPGPFYVVINPGDPITLLVIGAVALVGLVVISVLLKPKIPTVVSRNVQSQSPNNALSGRTNGIRVNGRIPDIFGTVRSTPDLIAVPYSVFIDHIEAEYAYMCVGRGTYAIDPANVRDGTTPVGKIDGEIVEIFGPNTSPNTGDAPQLRIGTTAIDRKVISALRSKSVNGQTLKAVNDSVEGALNDASTTFNFRYPGTIYFNPAQIHLNTDITVGHETITLSTSSVPNYAPAPYNLSGFVDYGPGGIFGAVFDSVGRHSGPVVLGNGAVGDTTFDATVRFYPGGQIEFQDISDIGTENRPMNRQGYAYIQLKNASFIQSGTHINLNGKYVAVRASGSILGIENPLNTTTDWSLISGISAWKLCTFVVPLFPTVNLSGVYNVTATSTNTLTLDNAGRVNSDWNWLKHMPAYHGNPIDEWIVDQHAFIGLGDISYTNWIGPFVLDVTTTTEIIANFVAVQGMYKDSGTAQTATSVDVQLGATPCTSAGDATGDEQFFSVTVEGSATERGTRAATMYADVSAPGRYMVRARRVTPKDLTFSGQVSDEVKWRDVYSSSPVGTIAFGDVTTLHCLTHATAEALAVQERQINLLVSRKIPKRISGSTFTTELYATSSADEIISFICLDKKIGNRKKAEVNFQNIYDTITDIKAYFVNNLAPTFNYTIDSDNLSFEETLQMVANAIFCTAHRRGNVIELIFERQQDSSVLLFNHRNKVPASEARTATFGNSDNYDGIEYTYVSPIDDAVVTFYIPEDRSAVKPRKIESVGIRTIEQAHWHAWREFNKLQYQHDSVEFEATQEADLLGAGDRILIADNTRPDTQDGEVIEQVGLVLTLSQPVIIKSGISYIIHLQLPSGTVQNIAISAGVDPYHVVLASATLEELSVDDNFVARTPFIVVRDDETKKAAFLVSEKSYNSNFTCNVQAINYDDKYYQNDYDFFANPPDEFAANVVLHVRFNGAANSTTFVDLTGRHTVTAAGGAKIQNTGTLYQGSSLILNGAGDHVVVSDNLSDFSLGSLPLTIEGWAFRIGSTGATQALMGCIGWEFIFTATANAVGINSTYSGSGSKGTGLDPVFPDGEWRHFAFCTDGEGAANYFENGKKYPCAGSGTLNLACSSPLWIGGNNVGGYPYWWNGALQEIRITANVERYTEDFQPPNFPFEADYPAPPP